MRVVHIISTLNIGGAENFVVQLANKQVEYHHVAIVTLKTTSNGKNYRTALNPKIEHIELGWKYKYRTSQLWQLNKLMNRMAPSVIHVHLHNPFYYVFALSFFKRKIRYIHTVHSSFDNWKSVLVIVHKLCFVNNVILHVALTRTISKSIREKFPKLQIATIANGIRPHTLCRKKEEITRFWNSFDISPQQGFRFLAIGNISNNKNYSLLALSFKALAKEHPEAMCILAGNALDKVLTKEIITIDAPNVFLAGPVDDAADLLAKADALVISSVQEGMPIVALEAMSMGIPIITTPAGGMPDLVNSDTGLISDNFEVRSFKDILIKFMALSQNEKSALGTNAKKRFNERYAMNIAEQHYRTHYGLE